MDTDFEIIIDVESYVGKLRCIEERKNEGETIDSNIKELIYVNTIECDLIKEIRKNNRKYWKERFFEKSEIDSKTNRIKKILKSFNKEPFKIEMVINLYGGCVTLNFDLEEYLDQNYNQSTSISDDEFREFKTMTDDIIRIMTNIFMKKFSYTNFLSVSSPKFRCYKIIGLPKYLDLLN